MLPALLLSEGIYKAADVGEAAAVQIMDTMQRGLPEHLCRLSAVQLSQPRGPQRCARRCSPSSVHARIMDRLRHLRKRFQRSAGNTAL